MSYRGSCDRPPLQPRDTPLDENSLENTADSECSSSSPLHLAHNKRLFCDTSLHETENEPLNHMKNKKLRTKTCPELGSVNLGIRNNLNNLVKSETTNLGEQNSDNLDTECKDIINNDTSSDVNVDQQSVNNIENFLNDNCVNASSSYSNPSSLEPNGNNSHSTHLEEIEENTNKKSSEISEEIRPPKENGVKLSLNGIPAEFSNGEESEDDNYLDSSASEENFHDLKPNRCQDDDDDDEDSCEDDLSIISSITVGSTCSLRSAASETMSSIYMNENGIASNEDGSLLYTNFVSTTPVNAISTSLFPHVPPTIHFCRYDECSEALSSDVSKLLKWKFTTITPMIVRKTISNSGFKIIKKTLTWGGTWGKHMKSNCFKSIKEYQKINHFPGSFQIGRKDKLWKNFAKFQAKFGRNEFGFIPKTFVLPEETNALKAVFSKNGLKKKWIVKPPASARGTGIQVVDKWSQLPTDTPMVVQRYITRPYLINNTKFDIRIYVLVTSFNPLRIFLYEDGLVRFASVPYQTSSSTLGDRFMHLTNYSVNKSSSSYTHNDDAGHCHGHKWTLKTLWGYLKTQDVDTGALWSRIVDIVIKTIIFGENEIVIRSKKFTKNNYNCFELFGFDVILDDKLRPWLLEVNISPSLHSASSLDHSVKGPLIADLLSLVGFHIPDKLSQERQVELLSEMNLGPNVSGLCLDRRIYTRLLTIEEQLKQVKVSGLNRNEWLKDVMENLQPNDIRQLVITEDQRHRSGKFACVFPTSDTHHYFGFMPKVRYYNRLFDAWETLYEGCREKGIEFLQNLCEKRAHLKVTSRFKMPKTACLPPAGQPLTSLLPFSPTTPIPDATACPVMPNQDAKACLVMPRQDASTCPDATACPIKPSQDALACLTARIPGAAAKCSSDNSCSKSDLKTDCEENAQIGSLPSQIETPE